MSGLVDPTPGEPEEGTALPRPSDVFSAAPGLVRITAAAGLHAARWGAATSWRTGRRLVGAVLREPGEAAALAPATDAPDEPARSTLRERGAELLDRSRDVWHEQDQHPAYARILGDLAPDEARVLLLLVRSGPQPSVDVRSGGPVGRVHSQLIAPGLTMIGARAGCRYVDRVPAYLDNLHRLGLVWFSREQLTDPEEYQVLEAQPDVLEALHAQRFTKVVRRSIHLTPFGEGFCRAVLLPADDASAYPSHVAPDDGEGEGHGYSPVSG